MPLLVPLPARAVLLLAGTEHHVLLLAGTEHHVLLLAGAAHNNYCMRAGIVVIDRKKDKVDRKDGKDNIVVSRK